MCAPGRVCSSNWEPDSMIRRSAPISVSWSMSSKTPTTPRMPGSTRCSESSRLTRRPARMLRMCRSGSNLWSIGSPLRREASSKPYRTITKHGHPCANRSWSWPPEGCSTRGMLSGSFVEQADDEHVRLRTELLDAGAVLPDPAPGPVPAAAAGGIRSLADRLLPALGRGGLAVLALDRPLDNTEFRALGAMLGTATPELDPAVQPFVEDGVVLNLRDVHGRT